MRDLTSLKVSLAKNKTERRLDLFPRYNRALFVPQNLPPSPAPCLGMHFSGMLQQTDLQRSTFQTDSLVLSFPFAATTRALTCSLTISSWRTRAGKQGCSTMGGGSFSVPWDFRWSLHHLSGRHTVAKHETLAQQRDEQVK